MKKTKWLNILNPAPAADAEWDLEKLHTAFAVSSSGLFDYTLITFGHKRLNPWPLAQYGMGRDSRFSPLIAINPIYNHPVETAQKVATLLALYSNSIGINLITGSFFNEMQSLNENTSPQQKQTRLVEFFKIFSALINDGELKGFAGEHYNFSTVRIHRPVARKVAVFISGQFASTVSDENVYFIHNLRPQDSLPAATQKNSGLGLGICTRPSAEEAQAALDEHWPQSREGEIMFKLSMANSQTPWNIWLREHLKTSLPKDAQFCLQPLMNFRSSSPYLVGSYEFVRTQIKNYTAKGYDTFLLDFRHEDFAHLERCLKDLGS